MSKLNDVDKKLKETTTILQKNIDVCIERGERLEDLQLKSEELENEAKRFKTVSRTLKQRLCKQNLKITCFIISVILFVIALLVISICNSTKCH